MIPLLSCLSKWGLILFSFLFFLLKWVFILFFLFVLSVICMICLVRCIIFILLRPSKDELLHHQVKNGNIEGIKALRSKGAGLEWVDIEGKTPLILACTNPNLYDVAKFLIELGANVNAYRPGLLAGTPLHHAARKGLEKTVKLLLSHGANALIINDNSQTPLEVARSEGYINVVRGIEGHLCLFSGWLRRIKVPGFLDLLAPQLFSRKVWVVVLPCSHNLREPFNLEVVIYAGDQDAQPQKIISLWNADLQEPNFDQPGPVAIIVDLSKSQQTKLGPVQESEKQQLQRFCNACKGIPQVPNVQATPPLDDGQLTMAIHTSLQSAEHERYASQVDSTSGSFNSTDESYTTDTSTSHNACTAIVERTPTDLSVGDISVHGVEKKKDGSASTCTICLDAPIEGACVPCGHMAGCMSCLKKIKARKWVCPICRTKINQVIRLYAV
ncbi:putative E3 ubiquitin-protein ligase XBAT35 [Primulina eburnea]|uniref:putative E3 ubiquitin-protein ligase XBAT35 n=1 Tax=Primulina eburnea TaxID=1245227 RepID=UPI003C6CAB3B